MIIQVTLINGRTLESETMTTTEVGDYRDQLLAGGSHVFMFPERNGKRLVSWSAVAYLSVYSDPVTPTNIDDPQLPVPAEPA